MAVKNPYLKRSVLGKKILDYGIISIDYIHQKIIQMIIQMIMNMMNQWIDIIH